VRKLYVFAAVALFLRGAAAATVWIDTDVSIGSPIREVDDAYALVLALHSPEIQIAGLSTTYGNAPLGHTARVAEDIVRRFGATAGLRVSEIHSGARSASDLGRRTAASDALAATLRKERVTYIALGPLTNLATFLRLHPGLAPRIERVIFLGGQSPGTSLALRPNGSFRIHDANVFKDPVATAVVLRSKIPLTAIPVATASKLLFDAADLRALEKSGEAGNYLARRSRIWLWFWRNVVKTNGGAVFDTLAVIAATKPRLLVIETRYARMDEKRNLRVTTRRTKGTRPIRYGTGFAPNTKQFVMRRMMTRRSCD
jgi:pyrimidine-specific ribonucleoside hydrolase